jgi:hypothetical protein
MWNQDEAEQRAITSAIQNDAGWKKILDACAAADIKNPWAFVESSKMLDRALECMRNSIPATRQDFFNGALQELKFGGDEQRHLATFIGELFDTPTPADEEFDKEQEEAVKRGETPRVKGAKEKDYCVTFDDLDFFL